MEKFAGLPVLLVGPFTDKLLKKYRNQIIGHKWGDYLNCESGYEILGRPLMDDPIFHILIRSLNNHPICAR